MLINLTTKVGRSALRICLYACVSFLFFSSCNSVKVHPKKVHFIAREVQSQKGLEDVQIDIVDPDGNSVLDETIKTDELGYAQLKVKDLKDYTKTKLDTGYFSLVYTKNFASTGPRKDKLPLNKYLKVYDLYLDSENAGSARLLVRKDEELTADMHYHVSMRTHNLFGHLLHDKDSHTPPENVNWYKDYKKLKVFYKGKWKKPYIGKVKFPADTDKQKRRRDKLKTLIEQQWIKPKSGANKLTHFTQATHPHIKEGNVYLAFNCFSPFEHTVANKWSKRNANSLLITGASMKWLKKIGWINGRMTHWENFKQEYETISNQSKGGHGFGWRFYDQSVNLTENKPTIINVVEGAHIFQDTLFPHELRYDLANRPSKESRNLLNKMIKLNYLATGSASKAYFDSLLGPVADKVELKSKAILDLLLLDDPVQEIGNIGWKRLADTAKLVIDQFIDSLLIKEITDNIDEFKNLSGPPVWMLAMGHLTYNGMVGHAPGLDGGSWLTNLIARKNYNIRVSDDPTYRDQWTSVFFTIPGVNKFGKAAINRLVSRKNGHRVLMDLKHCDFFTRKYFFEEIMLDKVNKNADGSPKVDHPPICSHCGATGLPSPYYSPLTDEYSLLQSPSTTTFYPFGINIYDEEIEMICQNGGIIGIPLEQRVLGGYINKRQVRDYKISVRGHIKEKVTYIQNRRRNNKRWFYYFFVQNDDVIKDAIDYTENTMGVEQRDRTDRLRRYKRILDCTSTDYISAEPFLQNLFYFVDKSGLPVDEAWDRICIGSDLDGLIDPIDICPSASHYPKFKQRLKQFIPIFLKIRKANDPSAHDYAHYFDSAAEVDTALTKVFYLSLRNFTQTYFK